VAGSGDPISVVPDQAIVHGGGNVFVTVAAVNTPAAIKSPRGSLIVYAPDGTMIQPHSKSLRKGGSAFRVKLGATPQVGTYTVFATVEVDTAAFGMPTTFEVAGD
jgi:hypothetical protein